jgi:hydroxyacylglutathione hydrolase
MIDVQTFVSPGFAENAYLVRANESRRVVAIDPGADAQAMASAIHAAGVTLEAVLLTHAHLDHIEGVARLVSSHPAPIHLHPGDRAFYERAAEQASWFGMTVDALPPVTHELADTQVLELAGLHFEVRHVPGHAPGHVLLYVANAGVAFVGDVVFQGSIGRTDLPGGDYRQLMASIRDSVLTLPPDTTLYSGHGPATTVGHERASNPFLGPHFGGGLA